MASYLGAADTSGSMAVLARNVTVNPGTTAAQVLCTPGQRCIPLYVVLRAGATALSSTTSFSVGVTGALASIVATTIATSLATGATNCMIKGAVATQNSVAVAAGSSIYFSGVQVDPTATASVVDVVGYLF